MIKNDVKKIILLRNELLEEPVRKNKNKSKKCWLILFYIVYTERLFNKGVFKYDIKLEWGRGGGSGKSARGGGAGGHENLISHFFPKCRN